LLAFSAGLGLRSLRRMVYMLHHHYQPLAEKERRVLILGAGLLGLMTAQDLRQYPHMSLVGFLDDDPAKTRRRMAGCRILGSTSNLEDLCVSQQVTDLMICAKAIPPRRRLEIERSCEGLGVKVHMIPSLDLLVREERELSLPTPLPAALASYPQ
jgi:FlaA1/EpsC-like NDP-sugar epimerase